MLHVFYRACSTENDKARPVFYSKLRCLANFLAAFERVAEATFCLVYDGNVGEDFRSRVEPIGSIERLPNVGNSASFWYAFNLALNLPDKDLVYFVEDDYLHRRDALQKLVECVQCIDADYITLYDHPARYMSDCPQGADLPLRENAVYVSRSHHWRTVESSCMTFASRAGVIREDIKLFETHIKQTGVPADRALFRHLQGLGSYRNGSPRRKLIGPIPSLATHCQEPWLAPVVNWKAVVDGEQIQQ
jgi:hypothetical protein